VPTITKINHLGNSKLIQLIKTLSTKELKELKDWLASPWCKKNKYYLPFYEILYQAAPKFSVDSLLKIPIFDQLYEGKSYNNAIFNNLILSLTKEVQSYVAFLYSHTSKKEQPQLLRKYFLERNAIVLYEATTKSQLKKLEQQAAKDAEDYLLINRLHQEFYFQPSGHVRYQVDSPHLVAANGSLDAFYLLEKYKYLHESAARTKIVHLATPSLLQTDITLLAELQRQLALEAVPLYKIRLENTKEQLEAYLHFKELYLEVFPKLSYAHQQSFLVFCINDAIHLDIRGYPKAMEELFDWYQRGLKNGLLLQQGKINEATYNNIILTACYVDKKSFLIEFIDNYSSKLPATIRKEAALWAQAQLAVAQGKYKRVINQYANWLPKDKRYALQTKITLLKANYKLATEEDDFKDDFDKYCAAFEQYIRRSNLYTADKRLAYLKFIQYVRRLAARQYDKKGKILLERAIEKEPLLIGKGWLKKELNR